MPTRLLTGKSVVASSFRVWYMPEVDRSSPPSNHHPLTHKVSTHQLNHLFFTAPNPQHPQNASDMAGLPQVPTTAPPSEDRPAPDALQTAGEIPIYDADGKEFLFRELYELKENAPSDELLMVIFIRHFYCSSCQA